MGGAECNLRNVAVELMKQGHEVHLLFLSRPRFGGWKRYSEGMTIHAIGSDSERIGLLKLIPALRRLTDLSFGYTFCSHISINGLVGLARRAKLFKTEKLILRESTLVFDRFDQVKRLVARLLYRVGYSASDLLICQTREMADRLQQELRFAKYWPIEVIPNAIDVEALRKETAHCQSLKTLDFPFILGIGRLISIKGFDTLIRAWAKLDQQIHLVLAGQGQEKQSLIALARELGVLERLHLVGHLENPYPYLEKANACVVSSLIEGFPNTLLEMMALNSAVVSTTCADGISDMPGLITCPPGNVSELKRAIGSALALSENERQANRKRFDLELVDRSPSAYLQEIEHHVTTG